MGERAADDLRLLVNFLGHEVAVVALVDQEGARLQRLATALDQIVVGVVEGRSLAGERHPIALVEIGD